MARKKAAPDEVSNQPNEETEMTETEATTTETAVKPTRLPPENITMTDGRVVEFTGRTRMNKTVLIDGESVAVRFDFRNGQTATYPVPAQLLLQAAGHGWSQKLGDHVAGMKDEQTKEPATEEDMFLAIESLYADLQSGDWNKVKSGEGTVSGASLVLKALAQHFNKPVAAIKTIIENRLAADKERGGTLSRKALYASFRNPDTELGQLILRLESERKKPKAVEVDLDSLMTEMQEA